MEYYIANDGLQQGPIELRDLPQHGLCADSLIWTEGMTDWQRADSIAELADLIPKPPITSSSSPPPLVIAYQTPPVGQSNGMAVASLVLGIVAITLSCNFIIGLVPGILAIIFGLIARGKIKRGETSVGNGMALAGIICGAVPVAIAVIVLIVVLSVVLINMMHSL
ncbi:MAG TPA: DUF4190 domain-containing protein [Tepidisphaeraceae bacterium]|nr:DUF4190 domain-containing protein [Tepidisphaeraceae bacterium]